MNCRLLKVDALESDLVITIAANEFHLVYGQTGLHTSVTTGMTASSELNGGTSACDLGGSPGDDVAVDIEVILDNTDLTFDIMIGTTALNTNGGWGIRDLQIFT